MMSVHSSKMLRQKLVPGTGGLLRWFGRMWIRGLWIWKVVRCFKWRLMDDPSKNMEDFVSKSDLTVQTWSKRFQWRRTSVCGLETVFIVF